MLAILFRVLWRIETNKNEHTPAGGLPFSNLMNSVMRFCHAVSTATPCRYLIIGRSHGGKFSSFVGFFVVAGPSHITMSSLAPVGRSVETETLVSSTWAMGTAGCTASRVSLVSAGVSVVSVWEDTTSLLVTTTTDEDFSASETTVLGVGRPVVLLAVGGIKELVGTGVGVVVAVALEMCQLSWSSQSNHASYLILSFTRSDSHLVIGSFWACFPFFAFDTFDNSFCVSSSGIGYCASKSASISLI